MAAWSAFCHGAMHALHTNYTRFRHSNQHISIEHAANFMLQYRVVLSSYYAVAALLLLQQLRTNWISGFWILDLAFGGLGLAGLRSVASYSTFNRAIVPLLPCLHLPQR